ncbi:MAG TPA: aminoacetone oxidase family FAD-binding enzyme [Rikenellaceae bacterium]|nr:aminoacetone oxidase family FAD-binding enzyme [Rikenellaceae bacterium]
MKIAIVGAGAAGCFCAIELKRRVPSASVEVFEAGPKALAKVAITGGGRCNLTNSFEGISSLSASYPRGDKLMKRLFRTFDQRSVWKWFENEGVKLVLQEDHCVFPASQDAMEIVDTLLTRMRKTGVVLHTRHKVTGIFPHQEGGYTISTEFSGRQSLRQAQRPVCSAPEPVNSVPELVEGPMSQNPRRQDNHEYSADIVVVTTGGSPKLSGLGMLDSLSLEIIPPVPSLFTFNLPADPVRELMGTVVENASVSLSGTKFKANGPLLITHWGMSGPAILKLSSYAARYLAENEYSAALSVNWFGDSDEQDIRAGIMSVSKDNSHKLILNTHPSELPSRLWNYLISKSGIRDDARWAELGSKGMNRLVNTLINDGYQIRGKSRFKEEFVTCGGVALSNINLSTLECKTYPGLYFAGEVLDVDAITGGFNLQAAWTTGYVVAQSVESLFQ